MSLSGVKSATALFNLVFSCSSSFKRLAWDIFIPAYSLSPAVKSLFCNPEIPAHLPDALALRQMNLCLPKHLMICSTVKRFRFILTSYRPQILPQVLLRIWTSSWRSGHARPARCGFCFPAVC